ncbi:MAG: YkvA family protein [Microcoleaceae cyanobacterium]
MKDSLFQNLYRKFLSNPKYRWLVIAGSALYLLSPLDISPDLIPIVGWIDDGIIAALLVSEVTQLILQRRQTMKQNRAASQSTPAPSGEPALPSEKK